MYTTSYCPYCWRAKALLDQKRVPYEEVDVEGDQETRRWLVKVTGRRTVPQIFIGGRPIGGCDELHELERRGELDRLLSAGEEAQPV
jgi:glutaredoxin 3